METKNCFLAAGGGNGRIQLQAPLQDAVSCPREDRDFDLDRINRILGVNRCPHG
jgi:hypothetical protein